MLAQLELTKTTFFSGDKIIKEVDMSNINSKKVEIEEKAKEQKSNEFIVLEAFSDARYCKGAVNDSLECRVIKYGNQPTPDEKTPDVKLLVRADIDKRTLLQLLDDLWKVVGTKVQTDIVGEQSFDPPYGIFTFTFPGAKRGYLMPYSDEYFCTCSAEFHEPCSCKELYGLGHPNIITQYD